MTTMGIWPRWHEVCIRDGRRASHMKHTRLMKDWIRAHLVADTVSFTGEHPARQHEIRLFNQLSHEERLHGLKIIGIINAIINGDFTEKGI